MKFSTKSFFTKCDQMHICLWLSVPFVVYFQQYFDFLIIVFIVTKYYSKLEWLPNTNKHTHTHTQIYIYIFFFFIKNAGLETTNEQKVFSRKFLKIFLKKFQTFKLELFAKIINGFQPLK